MQKLNDQECPPPVPEPQHRRLLRVARLPEVELGVVVEEDVPLERRELEVVPSLGQGARAGSSAT